MTQADVTAAFAARDAAMLLHIKGVLSANGGSYPDDVTLPQAKELLVEQLKTKLTQQDISHMTQQEYESETPLHFPVLLDVNLGAVEKFDIKGALAKPTSLIVDKEGLVRFAYVGESYDDRPSAKLLLEALDETSK